MSQSTSLFMNQGSDTTFTIYVTNDDGTPKDLSEYTVRSKFARSHASVTTHDFLAGVRTPSTAGIVDLTLSPSDTTSIKPGLYVFDTEIVYGLGDSDQNVERVLEGILEISPSVTQ